MRKVIETTGATIDEAIDNALLQLGCSRGDEGVEIEVIARPKSGFLGFGKEPAKVRVSVEGTPADTFVRLDGFQKGFVMVNGHNLGRYFNAAGPQKTLYVPAPFLREGDNEVVVFESDSTDRLSVEFFAEPDLGPVKWER